MSMNMLSNTSCDAWVLCAGRKLQRGLLMNLSGGQRNGCRVGGSGLCTM